MNARQWLELARSKDRSRPALRWIHRVRRGWLTTDGLRTHVVLDGPRPDRVSIPPIVADAFQREIPPATPFRALEVDGVTMTWGAERDDEALAEVHELIRPILEERPLWPRLVGPVKEWRRCINGDVFFAPSTVRVPRITLEERAGFDAGRSGTFEPRLIRDALAHARPDDLAAVEYTDDTTTPCIVTVLGMTKAIIAPGGVPWGHA